MTGFTGSQALYGYGETQLQTVLEDGRGEEEFHSSYTGADLLVGPVRSHQPTQICNIISSFDHRTIVAVLPLPWPNIAAHTALRAPIQPAPLMTPS